MPEETISTASPEGSASATSATGTNASGGNGQQNGGASGQGATASDSFIPQGIDLNTLPPQVRAYVDEVNKQMVRGFTEKTTKLSETVKAQVAKELDPYRQKATTYDQLVQQEEFVKRWNDYVKEVNGKNQPAVDPNDPQAKLLQEVQQLKQSQEQILAKARSAEAMEHITAFENAVDEKGEKLHPDFDKFASLSIGIHQKAGNYDLLRASVELAPGNTPQEKLDNGYKAAKAVYDAIFEEGKKAGMGRLQQKVLNGTTPPSGSKAPSNSNARPSALEALRMATRGESVQR